MITDNLGTLCSEKIVFYKILFQALISFASLRRRGRSTGTIVSESVDRGCVFGAVASDVVIFKLSPTGVVTGGAVSEVTPTPFVSEVEVVWRAPAEAVVSDVAAIGLIHAEVVARVGGLECTPGVFTVQILRFGFKPSTAAVGAAGFECTPAEFNVWVEVFRRTPTGVPTKVVKFGVEPEASAAKVAAF